MKKNIKDILKWILFAPVLFLLVKNAHVSLQATFDLFITLVTWKANEGNTLSLIVSSFLSSLSGLMIAYYTGLQILPNSKKTFQVFLYWYFLLSIFVIWAKFGNFWRFQNEEILIDLVKLSWYILWFYLVSKFAKTSSLKDTHHENKSIWIRIWNNNFTKYFRMIIFIPLALTLSYFIHRWILWFGLWLVLVFLISAKWYMILLYGVLLGILGLFLITFIVAFISVVIPLVVGFVSLLFPNKWVGVLIYCIFSLFLVVIISYRFIAEAFIQAPWYNIFLVILPTIGGCIMFLVLPLQAFLQMYVYEINKEKQ